MPPTTLVDTKAPPSPTVTSMHNPAIEANAKLPGQHDKVQQLVALLRAELDGSGQLNAIKAQLATTASTLVLRKSPAHAKLGPAQMPEATLSLVADCLDHYGFKHSLNTLLVESGLSRDQVIKRPQLVKQLGLSNADGMESGSLVDLLTKQSSRPTPSGATSRVEEPWAASIAANQTTTPSASARTALPTLAPLRTTPSSSPPAPPVPPLPVSTAASTVPATNNPPASTSPPTQAHPLANAAAARPHTAPPLTPLPPTPPKVSTKDIVQSQPAPPLHVHPVTARSQPPEAQPIGASPPSPGPLDLSQLSSIPSQVTSEDLGLSGGSSPASTSVLSTEDYSVSVSLAQGGGVGGEFRGLGLDTKRQVSAWMKEKEFHMKP